jgi:ATP-binding cassette, subfamily B, bacterial
LLILRPYARAAASALRLQWKAAGLWNLIPFVFTLVAGIVPVVAATLMRRLVDDLTRPGASTSAVRLAIAVGILGAAVPVVSNISSYATSVSKQRLIVYSGLRLFDRVSRFTGLRHFEDPAFRNRLVLAEQAAQTAPTIVTASIQQVIQACTIIAGFLGALLIIWPPMTLLLVLFALPALATQLTRARQLAAISKQMTGTQRKALLYKSLLLSPTAAMEMRLFGFGPLFVERYRGLLSATSGQTLSLDRKNAIQQSALSLLTGLVTTIGLVVVVDGVASHKFSIGDLTLFIAAVAGVQGSLAMVILRASEIGWALSLFPHYDAITDAPDDLAIGSVTPSRLIGALDVRNVWFRYDTNGPWVLRGVNLSVPAGGTVGLVGFNGAGKSTLVKLLTRLYDPDHGSITWDGVDIRNFDANEFRRRLSATFQEFETYDLTAAENIGLGAPEQHNNRARIKRVAANVGMASALEALPNGYDTLLSRVFADDQDRAGVTLSRGQWQRVAVARSLMRAEADILILDEPSAGLDAHAEAQLSSALRRRRVGRTTLHISHRLGALRHADVIVVLDEGKVAEQGSHDELIARQGIYAKLFATQAAGYEALASQGSA